MRKSKITKLLFIFIICIAVLTGVTAVAGCVKSEVFYIVAFDSDGGSKVTQQRISEGGTAVEPNPPTKENYTFEYWYTGDGVQYDFSAPVTGDITLHAKWTANETETVYCTVTFEDGASVKTEKVEQGNKVNEPATPEKNGFTFDGWYTESNVKYDFNTAVTGDIKLTAKWTENDPDAVYYTVTFEDGASVKTERVEEGNKVNEPATPTKNGFTFDGWYTESNVKFDFNTAITGDITLTAKWTENGGTGETVYYTVTFDGNAENVTLVIQKALVESGKTLPAPDDPERNGFTIAGWYTDESCTTAYDFTKPVTGDITLYAKWTAKANLTVTYDTDGGSKVLAQLIPNGQKAVLPEAPTKSGCTFAGWYTDKECTNEYNFDSAVTTDFTLYAKWNDNSSSQPTEPDPTPAPQPKTYTYKYGAITSGLTDGTQLKQSDFTGVNSFITVSNENDGKVTYRDKASSSKGTAPDCIENSGGGLQVTFSGTGTITIKFASTGTTNTSSLALMDSDGNYLTGTTEATPITSDDALGNKANAYTVTGTAGVTVTYNITTAGTYTIYCKYYYVDGSETKSRGARITELTMTEIVEEN